MSERFEPLPPPENLPMVTTTVFYGRLGSNTVWGFIPDTGKPGVAIANSIGGQVVINEDNLNELVRLLSAPI